jgi:predicted RNase H-like nuclease (RuvC/YqgF family)
MIEPAMYLGIGFLVASLFGLIFIPLVHARAVRLTMRRMEAATPLSMAEIQADKDQLRAEFAMSTRRLEMSVEQLKAKSTSQLAELGKKNDAINRLKLELGEKSATIFALEAREKALKDQMKATEDELSVKTLGLHETERSLSDKQAEMTRITSDLGDRTATTEAQRVELISLKTQIEALKIRIGDYERDIKKTEDRLDKEREEAAAATLNLNQERGKVENLSKRVAELEQQLGVQTAEAEALSKRVAELDDRVVDQGRLLTERDYECDRLRTELENARRTSFHLREELNSASAQHRELIQNLTAEKEVLQKEFERSNGERAKLQSELAAMKREAESSWAAERVENALLRERINDVAAEVAKLAVTLEGPNSPIEAILAKAPSAAPAALKVANGPMLVATDVSADTEKGSLADRMRALQNRASRLSTSS